MGAEERRPGGERILHGRRRGRRLRPGQRRLAENLLPRLELAVPPGCGTLDPAAAFGVGYSRLWLEIGFGAGEHLAWQARAHPEIGMIGCEPYLNGVVRLLASVAREGLENVRIFRDDARLLLRALADASIERVFVLFPDPWPKPRHHRRRIVCGPVLDEIARILVDGGELRIATDDPGYRVWILEHMRATDALRWCARTPEDWRRRPDDWPATRYEDKALAAGRSCVYLRYRRRPRGHCTGGL